jgi:hypothetical protein
MDDGRQGAGLGNHKKVAALKKDTAKIVEA